MVASTLAQSSGVNSSGKPIEAWDGRIERRGGERRGHLRVDRTGVYGKVSARVGSTSALEGRGSIECPSIIAASSAMRGVMEKVRRFGPSAAPVLLTGESGTGKELVARSLHLQSPRAWGPFVALNCAALPDSLIEAELFGHERGAFTGAAASRQGRFEAAHGGTLFLDEIGEFPIAAQAKILRVIETGRLERLGSNESKSVDVRIISATHQSLTDKTAAGSFRLDLYYRLSVLDIRLPPLRSRPDDLEPLIEHLTARFGRPVRITPAARQVIMDHPFPGNVRELAHTLYRGAVLSESGTIDLEHLPTDMVHRDPAAPVSAAGVESLAEASRRFERHHLVRILEQTGGHRTQAARLLGISRKCLWEKMRLHGIEFPPTGRDHRSEA